MDTITGSYALAAVEAGEVMAPGLVACPPYVGDVTGRTKVELFARAAALLMPIRWDEPFGMVMIEALACGTPVVAFAEGAAVEIVLEGQNGFLVDDEDEMVAAIARLSELDPVRCRASVAARYDGDLVAHAYEGAYRHACAAPATSRPERPAWSGRGDPPRVAASAAPSNSAGRRVLTKEPTRATSP